MAPSDYSVLDTPDISMNSFYPRQVWTSTPAGAEDHNVAVQAGVTLSCRFFPAEFGDPTILFFYGNGEFLYSLCAADRSLAGVSLLRARSLQAAPEQSRQRFARVPTPGAFLSSLRESEPLLWRHLALMGPGFWHLSARQRGKALTP